MFVLEVVQRRPHQPALSLDLLECSDCMKWLKRPPGAQLSAWNEVHLQTAVDFVRISIWTRLYFTETGANQLGKCVFDLSNPRAPKRKAQKGDAQIPKQSKQGNEMIRRHFVTAKLKYFDTLSNLFYNFDPFPPGRSPAKLGTMVIDVAELIAQREEDEEGLEGLQFQLCAN